MMLAISNFSLRRVALAGSLACAVIPAAILGIGSAIAIRTATIAEEIRRAETQSALVAQILEKTLQAEMTSIADLGNMLRTVATPSTENVTPLLRLFNRQHANLDQLLFVGANGLVMAADAQDQADKGASLVGVNVADRDYLRDAMRRSETVISRNPIIGRVSGRQLIAMAAPAFSADGAVVGAVVGTLSIENIKDIISLSSYGRSGQVGVATERGTVIAHRNKDLVDQRFDLTKHELWRDIAGSASGGVEKYTDETGRARIAGYSTIPLVGWKVWTSRALDEIDQNIYANYAGDAALSALAVLIVALIGAYYTHKVVLPVETLRETAAKIAQGDLAQRSSTLGPREIVELAKSVNSMADAMHKRIEIEKKERQLLETAIGEFAVLATRVADGDLQAKVAENPDPALNRLGLSLNRMTESLSALVGDTQDAVSRLASAASEIVAATRQQVSATSEEAAAVRQTVATVAEVRQAAEMAARKTRHVADLAQKTATTAEDGRKSADDSIRGSEEARRRMEELAERILAFSEQAEAIAEINAAVGELAEQSNLLAVNAGIEAAKAGDAGKGFAVVASEIKALADRSKEATGQVRRIVIDIQKSAQSTVIAAEQGVKAATSGSAVAERSGQAIASLTGSVLEASQAAQQIMATAQQQEAGMDQIALAMKNIEQSSAQTVAALQQVERAASDLNALAGHLTRSVAKLAAENAKS